MTRSSMVAERSSIQRLAAVSVIAALALAVMPGSTVQAQGPLGPIECALHPEDDSCPRWVAHVAGAAPDELLPITIRSADGDTIYTVGSAIDDATGGTAACSIHAIDVATGLVAWNTVVPASDGCSMPFALVESADGAALYLNGLLWSSDVASYLGRIDASTGGVDWANTMADRIGTGVAVSDDGATVVALDWIEQETDNPVVTVRSYDALTGVVESAHEIDIAAYEGIFALEVKLAGDASTAWIGGAGERAGGSFDDVVPVTIAMDLDTGTIDWSTEAPLADGDCGGHLALSDDEERVYLGSTAGITTIDASDGTLVGHAPLVASTTWDDLALFFDVDIDETTGRVYMSGVVDIGAGLRGSVVAIDGTTGTKLWQYNDVTATGDSYYLDLDVEDDLLYVATAASEDDGLPSVPLLGGVGATYSASHRILSGTSGQVIEDRPYATASPIAFGTGVTAHDDGSVTLSGLEAASAGATSFFHVGYGV